MPLPSRARLGPYEIQAAIGAGGMGEVYKARDTRLDRSVAIKVLPAHVSADPERRARFEREAKTIAGLSHPHICTLHDVGEHPSTGSTGSPQAGSGQATLYLVMEYLTGETLAERLKKGPLPLEQALGVATEIADALSAAHRQGVIHRDLKPGNVMLTKAGAKLLDFGLAKLKGHGERPAAAHLESAPTQSTPLTGEGMIVGTLQYMAPEQLEGKPADARTDLWALGAILYEMVTGKRAFEGTSAASLIGAILEREPAPPSMLQPLTPSGVYWLVKRCLAKVPEDRPDTAHDVANDLRWVRETSGVAAAADRARPRRVPWFIGGLALGAAVIAAGVIAMRVARPAEPRAVTTSRQLTYQRGQLVSARFTEDGQTVVYTARWRGEPGRTFVARLDQAEAQAQPLVVDAVVAGVQAGQVLVRRSDGRLATVPLLGGAARDVAQGVREADVGPSGDLAIVRAPSANTGYRLEYPLGHVLWDSGAGEMRRIRDIKVAPDGTAVAWVRGVAGSGSGDLVIVDRAGRQTTLSAGWNDIGGLAWSADGREVWFTGSGHSSGGGGAVGSIKSLHAVSVSGVERSVYATIGDLTLLDVSKTGRVLVAHGRARAEARGELAGDAQERDLTFLDGTVVVALSADGTQLLFQEQGQAGGTRCTTYLYRVGEAGPVRLGDGSGVALSPDLRRVAALGGLNTELLVIRTDVSQTEEVRRGALAVFDWAWWLPDSAGMLVSAQEKGRPVRPYLIRKDQEPQAFAPEGIGCLGPVSPDGWVVCRHVGAADRHLRNVNGGEIQPAPWLPPDRRLIAWGSDGTHVFVAALEQPPFRVWRVNRRDGRTEPWLESSPADRAGIETFNSNGTALTPDGRYYAYCFARSLNDLVLIEGLK